MPTAEITYDGAIAYPLGDLKRGLSNIVSVVLSHSRFISGLGPGAQMMRVTEEAKKYASIRTAFGVTINNFGLVAAQLRKLDTYTERTTAASFKLQREILINEKADKGERVFDSETAEKHHRFHVRLLIMLHKMVATTDAVMVSELAMSIIGGHGLMEDFSSQPRMYRDAVVFSGAWEGPRNLLLTRIFMDIQKAVEWYPSAQLLNNLLVGAPKGQVEDDKTLVMCEQWEPFCFSLMHLYQYVARKEVHDQP